MEWEPDEEVTRLIETLKSYRTLNPKEVTDMSPIIAKENQNTFTPAPEGLHQAVCVDVVDKGMVEGKYGSRHTVQIRWQIDKLNPDNDNKSFLVVQSYTLSLGEKANLRKHLESWRGKKFTKEELDGFDVESLIGANCQLTITHNVHNGNTYANVQSIVPLGKGMTKMEPEGYVRQIDRAEAKTPDDQDSTVVTDDTEGLPF
jgi:hypothetical protein